MAVPATFNYIVADAAAVARQADPTRPVGFVNVISHHTGSVGCPSSVTC
jgi:hypothetical protein